MTKSKGIFIGRDLLRSKAWWSLGGIAKAVYMEFRLRCKVVKVKAGGKPGKRAGGWKIENNGEIVFTYKKDAERKFGLKYPARFTRAIDELIEKGFLSIESSGRGIYRVPTLYRMDERWRLYGKPGFERKTREKTNCKPGFKKKTTTINDSVLATKNDSVIRVLKTLSNGNIRKIVFKCRNGKCLQTKIA